MQICPSQGAHPTSRAKLRSRLTGTGPIREAIIARRMSNEKNICTRFEKARTEGDFPEDESPADWARYVMSVALGMAVKATSGASRDELYRVVDFAMRSWPKA